MKGGHPPQHDASPSDDEASDPGPKVPLSPLSESGYQLEFLEQPVSPGSISWQFTESPARLTGTEKETEASCWEVPCAPTPDGFRGNVFIKPRAEAWVFAMGSQGWRSESRTTEVCLDILWTDASIVFFSCAAGAIVWQESSTGEWMSRRCPYPYPVVNTTVVEIFAVVNALEIAVDRVREWQFAQENDGSGKFRHEVYVFTDSEGALRAIQRRKKRRQHAAELHALVQNAVDRSIELEELGALVELHLVPGHRNVPGNTRANNHSRTAARDLASQVGLTSLEEGMRLYREAFTTPLIAIPSGPSVLLSVANARCPGRSVSEPQKTGQDTDGSLSNTNAATLGIGFVQLVED